MEDINYRIWCDGSCYHTAKDKSLRTMGMGIYYTESTEDVKNPLIRRLAVSGPSGNHNEAEYLAIICALYDLYLIAGAKRSDQYAHTSGYAIIHSDSQIVIRQITGKYGVKKKHLSKLLDEVLNLVDDLERLNIRVEFKWNSREAEFQKEADWLSKVGNAYFKNIRADARVAHQVEGPTQLEEIMPPEIYNTIKHILKW